ncbi:MAG: hypothetical protein ACI9BF_000705, partial [Candidatus Paceibacteria bacterium]
SVEDVYADSIEFQPNAKAESYQSLGNSEVSGDKVFETLLQKFTELQKLINLCRQDIIPNGNEIQDFQIRKMQGLYNDMINLRNHITDTYVNLQELIETPVIEKSAQVEDGGDEELSDGVLVGSSEKNEVSYIKEMGENDSEIPDTSEVKPSFYLEEVVGVIDTYASTEQAITGVANTVNGVHKRMFELFPSSKKTEDLEVYLVELDTCVNRVKNLEKKIEDARNSNEDEVVLRSNLSRYTRVAHEIGVNAKVIEQVLLKNNGSSTQEEVKVKVSNNNENVVEHESYLGISIEQPEVVEGPDDGDSDDEQTETFAPFVRRKDMVILPDTDADKVVPIFVAERARLRLEKQLGKSISSNSKKTNTTVEEPRSMIVEESGSPNYMSVVAALESQDPINEIVSDEVLFLNHSKIANNETLSRREYLNEERYQSFIKMYSISPASFEKILDSKVVHFESETVDGIGKFFGDTFASPFSYLKDMTVAEVLILGNKPEVKFELQEKDIKYETFVAWMEFIIDMQQVVGDNPDMTFGELYARWIIETDINYHSNESKVA